MDWEVRSERRCIIGIRGVVVASFALIALPEMVLPAQDVVVSNAGLRAASIHRAG